MPNYMEMYKILFRSQTKAITLLQEAQQKTEEIYISEPPKILLLKSDTPKDDKSDNKE